MASMDRPPSSPFAAEIFAELEIDLRPLRDWWAGDGAMASRAFCSMGISRLIQHILDDEREIVLSSPDLWLMQDASAATDIAPHPVDFDQLLEWLRFTSLKEGLAPLDHPLLAFYRGFMPPLAEWGRLVASDVGLAPPPPPREKGGGGFLRRLFHREEPEDERLPLREIQDIPGFFKYLEALEGIRAGKGPDGPPKGESGP